jgi:hypothetical protein
LVGVTQERQPTWARQIIERSLRQGSARLTGKLRNIDENGTLPFNDRTRDEALRSIFALPRVDAEAPVMISAHEHAAINLAFAEQGALMRTASLKRSPPRRCPHNYDVDAISRNRMRTVAVKLIQAGDTCQCRPCHQL